MTFIRFIFRHIIYDTGCSFLYDACLFVLEREPNAAAALRVQYFSLLFKLCLSRVPLKKVARAVHI